MMTTFSSSNLKAWYVQVKTQVLYPNSTSNPRTKETLTADAVQKYLRENKFPVLIENGGMSYINTRNAGRG